MQQELRPGAHLGAGARGPVGACSRDRRSRRLRSLRRWAPSVSRAESSACSSDGRCFSSCRTAQCFGLACATRCVTSANTLRCVLLLCCLAMSALIARSWRPYACIKLQSADGRVCLSLQQVSSACRHPAWAKLGCRDGQKGSLGQGQAHLTGLFCPRESARVHALQRVVA